MLQPLPPPPPPPLPPLCIGAATAFNAGFGGCETYNTTTYPNGNHANCFKDYDQMTMALAASVCQECGQCDGFNAVPEWPILP